MSGIAGCVNLTLWDKRPSGVNILGVSGTWTHGSTAVISGNGFGTKATAKPAIWAHFDSGNIESDATLSTGTLSNTWCEATQVLTAHGNSAYAVRGIPNTDGTNTGKRNVRLYVDLGVNTADHFYIKVKRRYEHANFFQIGEPTYVCTNYKIMRQNQAPGGNKTDLVHTLINGTGSNIIVNEGSNSTAPGSDGKYFDAGWPTLQSWVDEEWEFSSGTLDVKDASYKYWRNAGTPTITWTFIGKTTHGDGDGLGNYPNNWQVLDVQNFWSANFTDSGPPALGAYVYFDDFYVDTTWARVMLGNAATWATCTVREPQIPTAWADGEITISVNLGALTNKWLYVVDANGNVNSDGYAVGVNILGVSGTWTHGGTGVISGNGFGTKNPAKPLIWAHFDAGNIESDAALSTGTLTGVVVDATQVDVYGANSTYAVRGLCYTVPEQVKQNPRLYPVLDSDHTFDHFFIHVKRKYGHSDYFNLAETDGLVCNNYKIFRQWPRVGVTYPDLVSTILWGEGAHIIQNENCGDGSSFNPGWPPLNEWFTEEWQFSQGTIDVSDATFTYWRNGGTPKKQWTFLGWSTAYPNRWVQLMVENYNSDNDYEPDQRKPVVGAYIYFDDFYVDTTWARVMLGNAATWADCTVREPQIPTAWASGEITVSVNLGALTNKWLYVVDANGNVNANGYAVT